MNEQILNKLKAIKEVVVTFATIITVVVALLAVKDWREEAIFKNNLDAAENVLVSTYQLRDAVFEVRYIYTEFFSLGSFRADERLKILSPVINNAKSNLFRAEVYFGKDTRSKIDSLIEIAEAIESTFRYSKLESVKKAEEVHEFFKHQKVADENMKLFFSEPDKDLLNIKIQNVVVSLEADLKPYFR